MFFVVMESPIKYTHSDEFVQRQVWQFEIKYYLDFLIFRKNIFRIFVYAIAVIATKTILQEF